MEKLPAIMRNASLSTTARVMYYWLRSTAKNGYSHESNGVLSEVLGVKYQTVAIIGRELQDANLVRRESALNGRGKRRWAILGVAMAIAIGAADPANATVHHAYLTPQISGESRSFIKTQEIGALTATKRNGHHRFDSVTGTETTGLTP